MKRKDRRTEQNGTDNNSKKRHLKISRDIVMHYKRRIFRLGTVALCKDGQEEQQRRADIKRTEEYIAQMPSPALFIMLRDGNQLILSKKLIYRSGKIQRDLPYGIDARISVSGLPFFYLLALNKNTLRKLLLGNFLLKVPSSTLSSPKMVLTR